MTYEGGAVSSLKDALRKCPVPPEAPKQNDVEWAYLVVFCVIMLFSGLVYECFTGKRIKVKGNFLTEDDCWNGKTRLFCCFEGFCCGPTLTFRGILKILLIANNRRAFFLVFLSVYSLTAQTMEANCRQTTEVKDFYTPKKTWFADGRPVVCDSGGNKTTNYCKYNWEDFTIRVNVTSKWWGAEVTEEKRVQAGTFWSTAPCVHSQISFLCARVWTGVTLFLSGALLFLFMIFNFFLPFSGTFAQQVYFEVEFENPFILHCLRGLFALSGSLFAFLLTIMVLAPERPGFDAFFTFFTSAIPGLIGFLDFMYFDSLIDYHMMKRYAKQHNHPIPKIEVHPKYNTLKTYKAVFTTSDSYFKSLIQFLALPDDYISDLLRDVRVYDNTKLLPSGGVQSPETQNLDVIVREQIPRVNTILKERGLSHLDPEVLLWYTDDDINKLREFLFMKKGTVGCELNIDLSQTLREERGQDKSCCCFSFFTVVETCCCCLFNPYKQWKDVTTDQELEQKLI